MTETTDNRQTKARRRRIIFTLVPLVLLLAAFAIYAWFGGAGRILSLLAAAALLFLYCLCIIRLIPQWQRAWSGEPLPAATPPTSKRSLRPSRMHPFSRIVFAAMLTRIILFLAVYLLYSAANGYQGGILDMLALWTPSGTQSSSWMALAVNWYPASGELLSLLPFYPAAVRLLSGLFGDPIVSGLFLSMLAFSLSAGLVYELTLFDTDRSTAMTAARWFCLLPGSLLLMLPTADSVFLFLCLCCMVLTRKGRYIPAALFGMIAAVTRLSGLLLVLPIAIELIAQYRRSAMPDASETKSKGKFLAAACGLLLLPLGTALYCLLSRSVTGDPFFLVTTGSLDPGYFFDAAAQHLNALLLALRQNILPSAIKHGVQLAHLFLPILLLAIAIPRMRTSHSAFLLLYLALTVSLMPTDIPRLVVSAYPLCPMLVSAIRRRFPRALVTVLLAAGLCVSACALAIQQFPL